MREFAPIVAVGNEVFKGSKTGRTEEIGSPTRKTPIKKWLVKPVRHLARVAASSKTDHRLAQVTANILYPP